MQILIQLHEYSISEMEISVQSRLRLPLPLHKKGESRTLSCIVDSTVYHHNLKWTLSHKNRVGFWVQLCLAVCFSKCKSIPVQRSSDFFAERLRIASRNIFCSTIYVVWCFAARDNAMLGFCSAKTLVSRESLFIFEKSFSELG